MNRMKFFSATLLCATLAACGGNKHEGAGLLGPELPEQKSAEKSGPKAPELPARSAAKQEPAKPADANAPTLAPGVTGSPAAPAAAAPPPGAASEQTSLAPDNTQPAEQDPAKVTLPTQLQTLQTLGQAQVIKVFKTDSPSITGYLVHQQGQYTVLYSVDKYLVAGALISPTGRNLTADYQEQYAPKPDYASVVAELDKDKTVFPEGPATAPSVYVFADPNCIFCKRFYDDAKPLTTTGKLRVEYVLVSFLRPTSEGRAAAVLKAHEPAAAWSLNENNFDTAQEAGGLPPADAPGPDLATALKAHQDLMEKVGGHGTPTVLFKTADGKWTARFGTPGAEWLALYAERGHE